MALKSLNLHTRLRSVFDLERLGKERMYYLILGFLLLLQLCPIWFSPYPAMSDYPNHLARVHILYYYGSNEAYQELYELEPGVIPNLAMDLMVPALMNIVSIEDSSKIFLSLIILLFGIGLHLLGLVVNDRPYWNALVAIFFVYNFTLSYGFVNYMFGMGLFFITLATWLRFRSSWTSIRLFSLIALAMLCYVSHLSAFVFLGISLSCLTAFQLIKTKLFQWGHVIGLLPLVPPSLTYLWYLSGIEASAPMEWWHPILLKKIMGLVYPFLSYNLVIDGGLGLAFIVLTIISLKLNEARIVRWELLLLGGVFLALYLVSPMKGAQSSYVDRRFLLPAAVFLFLALPIALSTRVVGRYVLIGFLTLPVMRAVEVWYYWNWIGHEVQKQVQLLEHLPEGSRLYPMVLHDQSSPKSWLWDMHFFYTAHYATIYRHAFVPTIYAWKTQNTLHMRLPNTGYVQTERDTLMDQVNWKAIFSKYDYLWGYKLSEEFKRFLLSNGQLVAQSGDAILIRIRKG